MTRSRASILLCLSLLFTILAQCSAQNVNDLDDDGIVRIGAFNMRVFGRSRIGNEDAVEIYSKIIRRYDLFLLQEIRDSSQTAIFQLLSRVNQDASSDGLNTTYNMSLSNRTGRTSSKEQYAYFYKTDLFEVLDSYDFNDDAADVFEREPYVARINILETDEEFFLVALHSKPDASGNLTVVELANLTTVYDDAVQRFGGLQTAVFMGDFNADCDYVSPEDFNHIPLYTMNDSFTWLIPSYDDETGMWDTTVSATDCAYDRIVVTNDLISSQAVVDGSASVFYFDQEYTLNNTFANTVSDHYPVEFSMRIDGNLIGDAAGRLDPWRTTWLGWW